MVPLNKSGLVRAKPGNFILKSLNRCFSNYYQVRTWPVFAETVTNGMMCSALFTKTLVDTFWLTTQDVNRISQAVARNFNWVVLLCKILDLFSDLFNKIVDFLTNLWFFKVVDLLYKFVVFQTGKKWTFLVKLLTSYLRGGFFHT